MVMGRRQGVTRSSWPIATTDLVGLAGQLSTASVRVPFRKPWSGEGTFPTTWPWPSPARPSGRSWATLLAAHRRVPLGRTGARRPVRGGPPPGGPLARRRPGRGRRGRRPGHLVPAGTRWSRGTVLYLHGGGYVGTSPRMYAVFAAWLCRRTGCDIFVADLRLAPEFPFPADLEDAVLVLEALLVGGVDPARLFVAGDSSGGGLVASLMYSMPRPATGPSPA